MKKKNQKLLALAAFGSSFILWGINTPLIKISVENMPGEFYLFIRFLMASIVLLPFALRTSDHIPGREWPRIIIGTLFGFILPLVLLNEGLERTSALNTSLLFLLGPAFMYLLSVRVLKERFNKKILLGLVVSLSGALLIVLAPVIQSSPTENAASLSGNLIILSSVIVAVLGTIIIKPSLKKVKPLQMTVARFNITILALLPFCIRDRNDIAAIEWTPLLVVAIAYGTFFATIVAYSIYHYGLGKISGEESSVLQYLDPLAGVIGAILILGDRLSPIIIVGGGLTVFGIYLSEIKTKHRLHHLHSHR